ncbi:hypothetical protein [Helicobacter salomonis]|uniref:hypothetical protein n=1 Tax=Helicobacter salomonis TaxID=56878 RepID=UPI001F2A0DC2|nr:hypothetical protein [Helicobacter salomonis]
MPNSNTNSCMPTLKILADASPSAGLGHLRRAQKLQKHLAHLNLEACVIAPHSLADRPLDWLHSDVIEQGDVLIVDSYLAPLSFYHHALTHVKTLIVFEDMPLNLPADTWVFNPSYGAAQLYFNPSARHFLGCAFMPYERAFQASTKVLKSIPKTLFVSFGGSVQSLPFYQQTLEILAHDPLEVHVVLPHAFVQSLPSTRINLHTHASLSEIATLMHACDIALLGAGGMLYEAMLSLTPILALSIAPNQAHQLQTLSKAHACIPTSLATLLTDLAQCNLEVRECCQAAQRTLGIGHALESSLREILYGY